MRQMKNDDVVAGADVSEGRKKNSLKHRGQSRNIFYPVFFVNFSFLFSDVDYLIRQAVRNLKTQNPSLEWKQLGH